MACLRAYPWPGNVRELDNVLARALALSQRQVLTSADLPGEISGEPPRPGQLIDDDWPTLDTLQRRYIDRVLECTGQNKTAAASILGVDRRTLQRMLTRLGRAP
jgi:DNA-binding NtrC family response regulator